MTLKKSVPRMIPISPGRERAAIAAQRTANGGVAESKKENEMAAKKDKKPSKAQERVFSRYNLDSRYFEILQDLPSSMMVRDKRTKQVRILEKSKFPVS